MTDCRLEIDRHTLVSARDGLMQEPERVTDVAVVAWCRRVGRRGRDPVRSVIVMVDGDVAVAIVAADVAPIDRTAADEQREQHRDTAAKETITDDAEPHPFRTVAIAARIVNAV